MAREFFRLQEECANEEIKIKIAPDSTHRHAHHLSLKVNVMAMSGGRTGHVANTGITRDGRK